MYSEDSQVDPFRLAHVCSIPHFFSEQMFV